MLVLPVTATGYPSYPPRLQEETDGVVAAERIARILKVRATSLVEVNAKGGEELLRWGLVFINRFTLRGAPSH